MDFSSKMEMHQTKSNMKRQRENGQSEQSKKSQRVDSTDEAIQTTKIIDLNDDCLTKIFGYLKLQSLFNVAVASEWLRSAEVYKREFGKKPVKLHGFDDFNLNSKGHGETASGPEHGTDIDIFDLKSCLQYLRCFGPYISNLLINYDFPKSKRYEYVNQYIGYFCADNLLSISMDNGSVLPIVKLLDLLKNKPSLKELTYDCGASVAMSVNSDEVQRLINEHPALVEFDLPEYHFTIDGVITLIRQLKSLKKVHVLMVHSKFFELASTINDSEWYLDFYPESYNYDDESHSPVILTRCY